MNTPEVQIGFVGVEDFATLEGTNTFRIGSNYDVILRPGDVVTLADEDLGKAVKGSATVADIFTGSLREMLAKHGEQNHFLAGEHNEVRVRDLKSFLVDNYGEVGQSVDDTTPFSVIYFEDVNIVEGVMGEELVVETATEEPETTEPALPPVVEEETAEEETED